MRQPSVLRAGQALRRARGRVVGAEAARSFRRGRIGPLTGGKICKQPLDEGFHLAVLSQHGTASESEFGHAPALGDNAAAAYRWVAQGLCRSYSEGYSPVPAT